MTKVCDMTNFSHSHINDRIVCDICPLMPAARLLLRSVRRPDDVFEKGHMFDTQAERDAWVAEMAPRTERVIEIRN